MSLKNIQKMQLLWVVLGLAYNAISIWQLKSGRPALSPTDPISGVIFVAIGGLIILAGLNGAKRFYQFSAPCFALLLSYSGVGLHVASFWSDVNLAGYASFGSWLMALLINVIGVSTLLLGSWLACRSTKT